MREKLQLIKFYWLWKGSMETSYLKIADQAVPMFTKSSPRRTKTISLRVNQAWLHISTPIVYNVGKFNDFIKSKHSRILDMRYKANQQYVKKEYISGESIIYRWKAYRLKVADSIGQEATVEFKWGRVFCYVPNHISQTMRRWYISLALDQRYKQKALESIVKETQILIEKYDFADKIEIGIKYYKSIYGKCRGRENVYFNHMIIKFPIHIIRHIILHELCHTKHMGHWKDFWMLLDTLDRDSEKHKKWILENGIKYLRW